MKTAVIYARYSCDAQTEQSIEGQLRVCKEYAERNDIIVLDTYIDRAMTGTNDNRPDFKRMVKDSSKREWDYVIVYKLDRFSRDRYAAAVHKHTLKENGVKLLSAMENIPDTPEGIILESLLEGMSQYYSAELSQKVKRGMNETRRKGYFTGGALLYGYKLVDRKIEIDPDKAEVVRYIYEQYSMGVHVCNIIASLTAKGILNRGKPFARNTVYKILNNEKYSGIYHYGDEIYTNLFPQIVPPEIFEGVRAKSVINKKGSRSSSTVYLLRGKVFCGYCGESMTADSAKSQSGRRTRYYKCKGRRAKNGCNKAQIRKEVLEQIVVDTTVKTLCKKRCIEALIDGVVQVQTEQLTKKSLIQVLIRDKTDLETSLDNLVKAIEKGVVTATTTKRISELEEQIQEYEHKILIEKSKLANVISREEVERYLKKALRQEAHALMELLVRWVVLYDDKIEIYYHYSDTQKPTNPDDSQGFCFYRKQISIPFPNTSSASPKYIQMNVELYV